MIDKIVKDYIDKLTYDDILTFAKTKNIILNNDEVIIIHKYITSYWQTLLHDDPSYIFTNLEKELSKDTVNKMKILYNEYFNKYKNYL